MRRRPPFAFALLIAMLSMSACRPAAEHDAPTGGPARTGDSDTAAAPADPAAAAAMEDARDPVAGTDAIALVERAPPTDLVPAQFDAREVAGTYSGTLPCADCPGIDTVLVLHVDGRYTLAETYRGRDTVIAGDGTWMPQPDGSSLLLDPTDKGQEDRRFAVISWDELRPLDRDGAAIDGGPDHSLRRRD